MINSRRKERVEHPCLLFIRQLALKHQINTLHKALFLNQLFQIIAANNFFSIGDVTNGGFPVHKWTKLKTYLVFNTDTTFFTARSSINWFVTYLCKMLEIRV